MGVYKKIAEMFWYDYSMEHALPPLVHTKVEMAGLGEHSMEEVLIALLKWMQARQSTGPLRDLRLVRNQTAQAAVDHIMGVSDGTD